jgi:hypothetical protein
MSREKCNQVKKFNKPGPDEILDDSDCRDKSKKLCRKFAGQASSGRVNLVANQRMRDVATLEKPTIEWVERQLEAAGSHSIQDKWSS